MRRPVPWIGPDLSIDGDTVIVAAGAWSRALDGLDGALPVRPVKGQIMGLDAGPTFDLRHVVRGPDAYVVPKDDGRVVVGATSEEMGFDGAITADGLYENLEGGGRRCRASSTWR